MGAAISEVRRGGIVLRPGGRCAANRSTRFTEAVGEMRIRTARDQRMMREDAKLRTFLDRHSMRSNL